MNERNLSRGLSTGIVDALKAHGHILVVKGGAIALARELGELMAPALAVIEPRLPVPLPLSASARAGEGSFGDETIDRVVGDLVGRMARSLMSSDHVEDVFAEDAIIRRDITRALREGLAAPPHHAEDQASVAVQLDTLGYVAATVSKRADAATLQGALDRAAAVARARFVSYDPDLREALFRVEGGSPDQRLELEEAVADELADLAEQGVAPLPTIERWIDLGRAVPPEGQRALAERIEAAAEKTLFRSGAAEWSFSDPRTMRVVFTPLSEQDARGVDLPAAAFARELSTLLGPGEAKPMVKSVQPAPQAAAPKASPAAPREPEEPVAAPRAAAPPEKAADSARARPGGRDAAVPAAAPSKPAPRARATTKAKKTASGTKAKVEPEAEPTPSGTGEAAPPSAAKRARAAKAPAKKG